jgi:hypothetical protein
MSEHFKICSQCKIEKEICEFSWRKQRGTYFTKCKSCMRYNNKLYARKRSINKGIQPRNDLWNPVDDQKLINSLKDGKSYKYIKENIIKNRTIIALRRRARKLNVGRPEYKVPTSEKFCKLCSTTKSLDFFGKDKNRAGGISLYCLECSNLQKSLYREERLKKTKKILTMMIL